MTPKEIPKEIDEHDITSESEFFDAIRRAKAEGKHGIEIVLNNDDKKEVKDKNKLTIDISKITQVSLDNMRKEIVEVISKTNDLDLMKKIEKCSYDKLILLLNVGFDEKSFYDTLNGDSEMKMQDIIFTEKSRDVLNKLLKEDTKENEKFIQKS